MRAPNLGDFADIELSSQPEKGKTKITGKIKDL